jgi:hypothetical protein
MRPRLRPAAFRLAFVRLAFVLLAMVAPASAAASWYPPDYHVCSARDVRQAGPFELIRDVWNFGTNGVALTVAYRGQLLSRFPASELHFYIRLNGHDIYVPASPGGHDDAYVFLRTGARDCSICAEYLRQNWPACDAWLRQGHSADWVCSGPTADEQELFGYAFNGTYLNAWDIEVAAEAHGEWDSAYGQNFAGRFESRYGCY